jgi:putative ABC transport system permease protein
MTAWLGPVRTASGGVRRHKLQTLVVAAVLFIATASAALGLALLSTSQSPFTRAFAAQRGADVTVTADPGRASAAQLARLAHVTGVTAMTGPYAETTLPLDFQGQSWGQNTLVARPQPGGTIDDLVLKPATGSPGPVKSCSTGRRRAAAGWCSAAS